MARKHLSAQAPSAKLSDEITAPLALVEPPNPATVAEPVAPFQIEAVEPVIILIADLKIDPDLQCRAKGINKQTVAEYAAAMKAGTVFPAVVAYVDSKGSRWLCDGFQRVAAASLAGLPEIVCDVRQGSRKDALLFAASANSQHGLRRTTKDKQRAVALVLGNFPKWSDRKVGDACGVDHKTVAATRARMQAPAGGEIPQPETDSGAAPSETASAVVDRLAKSIGLLFFKCPDERRPELRARLGEIMTDGDHARV